jgi:hypothetical protein
LFSSPENAGRATGFRQKKHGVVLKISGEKFSLQDLYPPVTWRNGTPVRERWGQVNDRKDLDANGVDMARKLWL